MMKRNLFDHVDLIKLICWLKVICIVKYAIQIVQHSGDVVKLVQQHTSANVVPLHVKLTVLSELNYLNHQVNIIIYHSLNPFSVECNSLNILIHKFFFSSNFSFVLLFQFSFFFCIVNFLSKIL